MEQPNAKEIIEVMSISNLGVAVGSLTVLGYGEEEIMNIVKLNIEKAHESMALIAGKELIKNG